MKPLEGIRVLALEHFGAAPYGTMFLASLGAEVIKVEPPDGGDPARQVGAQRLGEADGQYFQSWNLGKKSVVLDIKDPAGRRTFETLLKDAHALVNNLRGDQPAKLGLEYAQLAQVNPAIVCLHISAYGRDNERAAWPGFDYLMQAETGLMGLTGGPGEPPARFATSIIDCMTGMTGTAALLACLLRAQRTGRGGDVDVCLFDVALHQLSYTAVEYLNDGTATGRMRRSAHYSIAPVQTFPTADGWIFVMCMHDRFWRVLLEALGREDLASDPRFATGRARSENRAALSDALDAEYRRLPTAVWLERLRGRLPVAPVNELADALANPFLAATGMVQNAPHPARADLKVLASPVRIDGLRPVPTVCAGYGADTAALVGGTPTAARPSNRAVTLKQEQS